MQSAAWVSQLAENLDDEEVYFHTSMKVIEELETKLRSVQAEKEEAIERANTAHRALRVERILKDQLQTELSARANRVLELEERVLVLTNRATRLELEKKEAEDTVVYAQTHSFKLGYTDAVCEAKRLGLNYKKILLNPDEDPTLEPERVEEAAAAPSLAGQGAAHTHGDGDEARGSTS